MIARDFLLSQCYDSRKVLEGTDVLLGNESFRVQDSLLDGDVGKHLNQSGGAMLKNLQGFRANGHQRCSTPPDLQLLSSIAASSLYEPLCASPPTS